MRFTSTRGGEGNFDSREAVVLGLAPDGGLFMPVGLDYSSFPWKDLMNMNTYEMAEKILAFFFNDYTDMQSIVKRAYEGRFDTDELTPVKKFGDRYVLELFHGPTCAFKDVALSVLPVLMTDAKKSLGVPEETVILVATSGDTGSAALHGFKDREGIRIIVFYPNGGVSPVQEAQMTTISGDNVLTASMLGNFDDTQTNVKKVFLKAAAEGTEGFKLSSANSINIGRLVPQIVYYFKAYAEILKDGAIALGDQVDYTVPTGNFGDIFAGYLAKLMGLPVGRLVCASNKNNVLSDFFETGVYNKNRAFYKTNSPSMDILVSSNLERMLYVASGCDTAFVKDCMKKLTENGEYSVTPEVKAVLDATFTGGFASEEDIQETINRVFRESGYVIDTHTAVAWKVSEDYTEASGTKNPMVVLSTASPYKFASSVLTSIGETVPEDAFEALYKLSRVTGTPVPPALDGLEKREVRFKDVVKPDDMYTYVMEKASAK